MNLQHITRLALVGFGATFQFAVCGGAQEMPLRHLEPGTNDGTANLRVFAGQRSTNLIPAYITGKFAEHLRQNIYNGMYAQILRNPTLADYPFATGEMNPDGVVKFQSDRESIEQELRQTAERWGWPRKETAGLVQAYGDGLAAFWTREGAGVLPSPDTGEFGGRAQRLEIKAAGQGLAQWTYLPLFRTRKYNFEIMARSPNVTALTVSLTRRGEDQPAVTATIPGLDSQWRKFSGTLELASTVPAEAAYKLAVTANGPGQFVVQHIFLQPSDNIHGSDPDIIRFLKDAHLPLLRWPGGNFVSTYHWRDGVGPVEQRPTKPNYAWGAIEPNLFGTDEFIEFCRAVGCDPMICINGGTGTPEEAAQWVQYCNGPASSPMGKLRAANGHPQPYDIKTWEVGNELWGRWQDNWTTANGYVDRYHQFAAAMLKADPTITLYACGAPVFWGMDWNDTLITKSAPQIQRITDHPLIGGDVPAAADPLDVYRDFMATPEVLENKWATLEEHMRHAGIQDPHLAVTELQLFAHIAPAADSNTPAQLTRQNLPSQPTITEAVYDTLIYHAAIRLGSFVSLITHSAIVNHGAGLRKEHERVYANPAYYAQAGFAAFANAAPVAVDLACSTQRAPRVLSDLKKYVPEASYSTVDALAAIATDGSLLISIVNRDTQPVHLTTEIDDFHPAETAEVWTLQADVPWAANSLNHPDAIQPARSSVDIHAGKIELDLKPYGIVRLRIPAKP
jgi:alpha-N-arabinofuranosidase